MDRLIAWLEANRPADDGAVAICHGDFRLGNLMFHPSEPRVVAVLDWELSTLGHPLADLAYVLLFWRMGHGEYHGIGGLDLDALGIPSEDAFIARYFARRGVPSSLKPFHLSFALFRVALILEGVAERARKGNAADADAARVGGLAEDFTRRAVEVAGMD